MAVEPVPADRVLQRRPATPADASLLLLIYASTRIDEMLALDCTPAQRGEFLTQQFLAQQADYHQRFCDADFDIIVESGQPVGRLYVARTDREIRVLDIALLPEFRGQGIGTRLLQELLEEARQRSLPVRIHVACNNVRALQLYERLGFKRTTGTSSEMYSLLEWRPSNC